MKVLLDTCVSGAVVGVLMDVGHDVVWAGEWSKDPGDEEILARAHSECRVMVTLDKDFGVLAVMKGQQHSGIVRLVDLNSAQQGPVCVAVLSRHSDDLRQGAIITADAKRIRVRIRR